MAFQQCRKCSSFRWLFFCPFWPGSKHTSKLKSRSSSKKYFCQSSSLLHLLLFIELWFLVSVEFYDTVSQEANIFFSFEFWGLKMLRLENFWGLKKFRGQKSFGVRKTFWSKKLRLEIIWRKKIMVQKIFGLKTLKLKKIGVKKILSVSNPNP